MQVLACDYCEKVIKGMFFTVRTWPGHGVFDKCWDCHLKACWGCSLGGKYKCERY